MTMTRNKAIQVLDNERKEYIIKGCQLDKAIDMAIEALSAEAVQGWIPCIERLPSEDGFYLIQMNWIYCNMSVCQWADGWNCYRRDDGKVGRESEIDGADIIAWMPLPKPWEGGDDK